MLVNFKKRVGEIRTVKGLDRVRENDLFQMNKRHIMYKMIIAYKDD